MNTLELFARTGSFSKVANARGHNTFRIEINPEFPAEMHKDVMALTDKDLPKTLDVLWASPPCTSFSVASIGKNWTTDKYPKNSRAALGMAQVLRTLEIIEKIKPKYWFLENPRGMLRTLPFMKPYIRKTVSYCQYGDNRMKPTDIWTNMGFSWNPKPMCKPGSSCHIAAPRGSKTGTQGLANAKERAVIPPGLFHEIFDCIKRENNG